MADDSAFDVQALRAREFPALAESIYLNAASAAPIPERCRAAVAAFNDQRAGIHALTDESFVTPVRRSRQAAARLVGAEPDEIALGWNTSYGINLAALSLPVEPGTTVVVSDREFPANVYPWMHREELRLELVPTDGRGMPDEERILERLDRGDVSVFSLSAVQFVNGYRADLDRFGRFCRERGIFFVVDAIQAAGQLPLDVRAAHIDVLATGGHKWLCAPFGTGFAYVRRELHARMEPRVVGWTSMRACEDFSSLLDYRWELRSDARRFEVATLPIQDFAGFAESVELLLEVGVERIESHLRSVLQPLVEWAQERDDVEVLSDLAPARRSGIFSFRPPQADRVFARLREAGVHCVLREGAIRFSPHLYNTRDEMDRTLEIMQRGASEWT